MGAGGLGGPARGEPGAPGRALPAHPRGDGRHPGRRHVLALPARPEVLGGGREDPAREGGGLDLRHGEEGRAHEVSAPSNRLPTASLDTSRAAVRRVLWTTLLLNIVVSVSKIVVGKLSGSMSMVADGYHSLMDGTNNVVGLVVTHLAYRPPDEGHPYGHRKFETAATVLIGLALLGLAYNVMEQALGSAAHTRLPAIGLVNWIVQLGTLAVNLFVATYESWQ